MFFNHCPKIEGCKKLGKLIVLFFSLITAFQLSASEIASAQHQETDAHPHKAHAHHTNHIAVFVGATTNFEAEHTDFSLGIDYEYRLPLWHNRVGIGLFAEMVFASHKETIVGVPLFFHPISNFKIYYAPSVAIAKDEHDDNETHFLSRLGMGYDFHIKNMSLTPTLNADIIEGHVALVYGIGIGFGF